MSSANSHNSAAKSVKGLPPVTPPSGRFIAQLFLVPLGIVAGIALAFFTIIWLFGDALGGLGGTHTPAQFLDKLDRSNLDVRWRAAADLAQVLLRDDQLAANPTFALDLAERLRKAMDSSSSAEQELSQRLAKNPYLAERLNRLVQNEPDPERNPDDPEWKALETQWKSLEPDLNYILYLSASLGNFALPVGAPLLAELAEKEPLDENVVVTLQRRRAVWALANLGDNLRRFDNLPPALQDEALAKLEEESTGGGNRGRWSREVLDVLRLRQAGQSAAPGVDQALVRCAEDPYDPFLREIAGFAMGFWQGTPAEDERMEKALLWLTQDDGRGSDNLARLWTSLDLASMDSQPVTSKPGVRIQYNANISLARRGSDLVRLDMLEDMLDEDEQMSIHRLRRANGREDPDQATAYMTLMAALKAVAELHARKPDKVSERPALRTAIDKLAKSQNQAVRAEATRTRIALTGGNRP